MRSAMTSYEEAMDVADKELSPAHPNTLGLVLNTSLFYYVVMDMKEQACELAAKV